MKFSVNGYLFSCWTFAGTISLSTDISLPAPNPDPNEEITVWVNSDSPLFFMNLVIHVNGDATITEAMTEADCNDFGWEPNSMPASTVNPDSVELSGLNWSNNSKETIGYFKFRCNSGRVSVYIDEEAGFAFSWTEEFTYSPEPIVVGTWAFPPIIEPSEPQPILAEGTNDSSNFTRDQLDEGVAWPQAMGQMALDDEPNIIAVTSDITTNQVWDANSVYHVMGDPNSPWINIQALLVIEPGTTVIMGEGSGLFINSGGTLIAEGTPDKPITFTPDFMYFGNPGAIGYYWDVFGPFAYYYCPVYVQETSSPATTVRYCMIEGARGGIVTDNIRLENPIENNYLSGNVFGIYEYGPALTDIRNNLCFFNDYAGIQVNLLPDPNDTPLPEQVLTIEQNTCDNFQFCGIAIYGVEEPNDAPTVYLLNNAVTYSYYYGIFQTDWTKLLIVNTGYYGNTENKNWAFQEHYPVFAETFPYETGFGESPDRHHFLTADSAFVDGGYTPIEQTPFIGMTTNAASAPDTGTVDIGYHHIDWTFEGVEGITGATLTDLFTTVEYWLEWSPFEPNSPGYIDPNLFIFDPNHPEDYIDPNFVTFGGDWDNSGFVDMNDLTVLARTWSGSIKPIPLPLSFDQNPDHITGVLTVTLDTLDPMIFQAWLWMDGRIVSAFSPNDDEPGRAIIRTNNYRNGKHELKVICLQDDHIFTSPATGLIFDNGVSSVTMPKGFVQGQDYLIDGITDNNYHLQLYDEVTEAVTFASDCNDGFTLTIPASAFTTDYGLYALGIEKKPEPGEAAPLATAEEWIEYFLTHKFDIADPNNQRAKIVISIGSGDLEGPKEKGWKEVLITSIKKVYRPVLLRYDDCTWENLRFSLNLPQVKMWYHLSHGNHHLKGQPERQIVDINGGPVFSYLAKDFDPVPAGYEHMSRCYERCHSMLELGLRYTDKLIWVQFNACRSARTTEFAEALGIFGGGDPIGKQIFIGWKNSAPVNDILIGYNEWEKKYWEKLRYGNSLKSAVEDSLPGGGYVILDNFMYYGVVDYQYAYFRYPSIN